VTRVTTPTAHTLADVETAVRNAWSVETCDPVDVPDWHPGNPARGQCGTTALVLHDLLGGDLLLAEVRHSTGKRQGVHYWNRLPGGLEVDLTRGQFQDGEVIGPARAVTRRPGPPRRAADRYLLLRDRVYAALGLATPVLPRE
jgi:hypothetical protein